MMGNDADTIEEGMSKKVVQILFEMLGESSFHRKNISVIL